jgi:hypothetical protein
VVVLAAVGALLAAGVVNAADALADRRATSADIGSRLTVCAQSLIVRNDIPSAGDGYYIGELEKPETFTVESFNGDYVYGFAWGNTNKHGWVENGWFC